MPYPDMKLILVNSSTNIILNIEDISESNLPLDPSSDPSEENYYVTSQDYKVGDVYRYD